MASTGPSGGQGARGMQYGGAQGGGGGPGVGAARPSHRGVPPGVYNFSIPVRPIRADISVDHLERLASYYGLYGALIMVPGLAIVLLPLLTGFALELIFGWALIVAGVVTLLQFLFLLGAPGTVAFLLLALLHASVGFWLITEPLQALVAMAVVIAAWLLAQGIVKVGLSLSVSSISSWPLLLVSGLVSIALSVTTLSLFPTSPVWLLGLLVGGDFFLTGVSLLSISLLAAWGLRMVESTQEPLLTGPQAV